MNERIEKLISEAIKAIPDHVDFDLPKEFTEKFAELIVRQCALTAGLMEHQGRNGIGAQILDNFGVEQ